MAGIIKVDRVQSDSNLAFNVGGSNVSFFNSTGVNIVGGEIIAGGSTLRTTGGLLYANNGISFPVSQSSSANGNTLDDYEEGTWTPTVSTATTTAIGTYVKIGSIVHFSVRLAITSNASSTEFRFSLPFTSSGNSSEASASRAGAWFAYRNGGSATPGDTTFMVNDGTADIYAYNINGANRPNSDFNAALWLGGQYRTP